MSGAFAGPYLAGFAPAPAPAPGAPPPLCYGLTRLDHAVGNVERLIEAANYIMSFTGACRRGGEGAALALGSCRWAGGGGGRRGGGKTAGARRSPF